MTTVSPGWNRFAVDPGRYSTRRLPEVVPRAGTVKFSESTPTPGVISSRPSIARSKSVTNDVTCISRDQNVCVSALPPASTIQPAVRDAQFVAPIDASRGFPENAGCDPVPVDVKTCPVATAGRPTRDVAPAATTRSPGVQDARPVPPDPTGNGVDRSSAPPIVTLPLNV